jgi:hypothetical protein
VLFGGDVVVPWTACDVLLVRVPVAFDALLLVVRGFFAVVLVVAWGVRMRGKSTYEIWRTYGAVLFQSLLAWVQQSLDVLGFPSCHLPMRHVSNLCSERY